MEQKAKTYTEEDVTNRIEWDKLPDDWKERVLLDRKKKTLANDLFAKKIEAFGFIDSQGNAFGSSN
jgi:hypothetical protein